MEIRCDVCMHHCELNGEQTGPCRTRKNTEERVIPVNCGRIISLAPGPTEEKPLTMFCPGAVILSTGSFGYDLRYPFCQNHKISMAGEGESEAAYIEPGELAARTQVLRPWGNIGVVYTYNEPLMGWGYAHDTAHFIRAAGMKNVIVTDTSVTGPVLDEILSLTDAININPRGLTGQSHTKLGGDLGMARRSIRRTTEAYYAELTTLIVPGESDSEQEIKELAFRVDGISSDVPLHITRFFPRWEMTGRGAIDIHTVCSLAEAIRKSLKHVFVGDC